MVEQNNGREPIYFSDGVLFIPQYSGFGRQNRYERMISDYTEHIAASGRKIKFTAHNLDSDARKKNMAYDNHAYDFITGLFVPDKKYEAKRVFNENTAEGITK